MKVLAILLVLALCTMQEMDSDNIIILNEQNFREVTKDTPRLFVYFYSPWDGRCKSFDYTFRMLARKVEEEELDIKLAKINLPVNRGIYEIYRTRVYPSLHYFEKGDDSFYDGPQQIEDMFFYLQKKVTKGAIPVKTSDEITEHIKRGHPVVVGHFKKNTSKKYLHYLKATEHLNDIDVLVAVGPVAVDIDIDGVVVFPIDGEMYSYSGDFEVDDLKRFILINSLPCIVPYESFYTRQVFNSDIGVKVQLVYIHLNEAGNEKDGSRDILHMVARNNRGRFFVFDMDANSSNMKGYFGLSDDQLPLLLFMDLSEKTSRKYVYHGEMELEGVNGFIEQFFNKELTPYFKSEPAYEHLDGFVKMVVSRDFADVVYDPSKNVLVEFVVNGCRMCDRVEDDYQKLAESYINSDDVVIARCNTEKNDIKDMVVGQFPTFILFRAGGDGEEQVPFTNEQMDFTRLKDFVEKARAPAPKRVPKVEASSEREVEEVDHIPEEKRDTERGNENEEL